VSVYPKLLTFLKETRIAFFHYPGFNGQPLNGISGREKQA